MVSPHLQLQLGGLYQERVLLSGTGTEGPGNGGGGDLEGFEVGSGLAIEGFFGSRSTLCLNDTDITRNGMPNLAHFHLATSAAPERKDFASC